MPILIPMAITRRQWWSVRATMVRRPMGIRSRRTVRRQNKAGTIAPTRKDITPMSGPAMGPGKRYRCHPKEAHRRGVDRELHRESLPAVKPSCGGGALMELFPCECYYPAG